MKIVPSTEAEVQNAERVLRLVWFIVAGAIIVSVLTVTPLVERVTPDGWGIIAPITPLVVDAAVVIVVRVDAIIGRLGAETRGWPTVLRWMTGLMTLGLNIGDSALNHNLVGVAVHSVAPLLLIGSTEASSAYRRNITKAVASIEKKKAGETEAAEQRREAKAREERERQERLAEDERAWEREQRDNAAKEREAERQHTLTVERERTAREERARRDEQDRQDALRREAEERAAKELEADRKSREKIAIAQARSAVPVSVAPRPTAAPRVLAADAMAAVRRSATAAIEQAPRPTLQSATASATATRHENATAATGKTPRPATATRHESATEGAPQTATGSATADERDAAKTAIEALYVRFSRRPREGEMVTELERIGAPFTSRQFANKIRAEIETAKPHLASIGANPATATAGR